MGSKDLRIHVARFSRLSGVKRLPKDACEYAAEELHNLLHEILINATANAAIEGRKRIKVSDITQRH